MVRVRLLICAAAAATVSTTAFAADMPQYLPPQPQYTYQPMPVVMEQPEGAWYLRGDIGVGITSQLEFVYLQNPLNSSNFAIQHAAMADTVFFDGGVGYEFNNWLRFDFTAEYRSKSAINAFGIYSFGGGTFGDQYNAFLKSDVFLANAYVDLGTWNCLTPFVGFGIGGAYNTFADLTDIGIATSGSGLGTNASELNFAWALHAGLAYRVTQNFTMEFAYRYLSYGSVTDQILCTGGCIPDSYRLQNLTSQDFMLGMRWRFPIESGPTYVEQPAPIMMQQAPVYTQPAPVYTQPGPVMMQPAPMMMPQGAPMMMPQQAPMMMPQGAPMMMPQPQAPLSTRG